MAQSIARALTENALDAVERLADHLYATSPPLDPDAGVATQARLAASACASGATALLTILHALADDPPGLSTEQHLERHRQLADDAKKAGRSAYRASQSLSGPRP